MIRDSDKRRLDVLAAAIMNGQRAPRLVALSEEQRAAHRGYRKRLIEFVASFTSPEGAYAVMINAEGPTLRDDVWHTRLGPCLITASDTAATAASKYDQFLKV